MKFHVKNLLTVLEYIPKNDNFVVTSVITLKVESTETEQLHVSDFTFIFSFSRKTSLVQQGKT